MDDDCDSSGLVIDLDDDKEEENNIGNERSRSRAVHDNKANKQISEEDKGVGKKSDEITVASRDKNYDCILDDDDIIQIIDDDEDDYEQSVQKLIIVAHKVRKEYIKNKQSNEAVDYRKRKSGTQEYQNNVIREGNINRLGYTRTFDEDQNQVNIDHSRNHLARCVRENQPTARSGYAPDVYQGRYTLDDCVPYSADKNSNIPWRTDLPHRLEGPHAYRYVDMYKSAANVDEYYAAVNRYAHHFYRPEIQIGNDYYRDAARNVYGYVYGPELLSLDDYRRAAINRDVNNHAYESDVALNLHKYRHGAFNRDINNHGYIPEIDLTNDDCSCVSMNRVLYDHAYRPELASSNDYYTHAKQKRAACSHTHRPEENVIDKKYRYVTVNRFPYTHAHVDDALDNYWPGYMTRHAYKPEVVSIGDFGRAEINKNHSNGYRPPVALNLDPYRSELTHLYRPDIVNILEPTLPRSMYPKAVGMYYIPQIIPAYIPYDDARKKDEAILNLTRKPEAINVANTSTHEMDGSKLRTILSTNKPEATVPVVTNRSNTEILSTKTVCRNGTSNTQVQTDALATTYTLHDHYDHNNLTVAKNKETVINTTGHVMHQDNEVHEDKQKNLVIERDTAKVELDSNIKFLVVFFTRVKELVKEPFPEFSKSLEREIENLGEVAGNGKVKTDIQFICPLYCSVSTYSLPRSNRIDDDNNIEKHINRTNICDVCSCIQSCYKLYKKKYFSLLSKITNEKQDNENNKGRKRKIMTLLAGSRNREQTVICSQKSTNCEEIRCANYIEVDKKSRMNPAGTKTEGNFHKVSLEHKNSKEVADDVTKNQVIKLNDKTLLVSLSISNIDKGTTHNNITNNKMNIEKLLQSTASRENEEMAFKNTVDSNPKDEAEANLILSLSYNEITNADIISSKFKNKSGRKPDTVFTCLICSRIFIYFTSFLSHMQKEHDINGIEEDLSEECIARKCKFCGTYSKQKDLNEHVKRAHPLVSPHEGETSEVQMLKEDEKRKYKKRKFIFTCLVCHKNLKSAEVKRHREKEHKGVNVEKMFTKKLSTLD